MLVWRSTSSDIGHAQDGLVGNRVIPALGLWGVVLAMERAFPILMSPGVDLVKASCGASAQSMEELWVQQVLTMPCLGAALVAVQRQAFKWLLSRTRLNLGHSHSFAQ